MLIYGIIDVSYFRKGGLFMIKTIEGIFLVVFAVTFPSVSQDAAVIILSMGLSLAAMGIDDLITRRK